MIDPLHSIAFSIQANPGVYAVLLGSGVSSAAKIPTGWEITLDLIRKLANLQKESCDPDPARWYLDKYSKEANYSDLLNTLAKTSDERQQILRPYFESNEQEREDVGKQPTEAHRAIAALAARGFIRVILTTNFDRLVETALTDAGVVPQILSTSDQVKGALPLIHTKCCVFKVHGDYLDSRIRNTPAELDEYTPVFDKLLDRIFDEFGLIVCGWSAEWDGALRSALNRASSRRFTTYWALRGNPGDKAKQLIRHRGAQEIPIEDADSFFQSIQQHVESIDEFSRPHPLSIEAAVGSLKHYLSDPRYRIQLSDLIEDEVERVCKAISGEDFAVDVGTPWTRESVTERVCRYEAACSTLLAMALQGGRWAEEEHHPLWQRALQRLGSQTSNSGVLNWLELQRYPATLLLYALGIGAVEANRLQFLRCLLNTTLHVENQKYVPVAQKLPPSRLSQSGREWMQILEGMDKCYVPLNDWIHLTLQPYAERILHDGKQYILVFDQLEILMALSFAYQKNIWSESYKTPLGAFGYRRTNCDRFIQVIEESLVKEQGESLFVKCEIFGETVEECKRGITVFKQFISKIDWWW